MLPGKWCLGQRWPLWGLRSMLWCMLFAQIGHRSIHFNFPFLFIHPLAKGRRCLWEAVCCATPLAGSKGRSVAPQAADLPMQKKFSQNSQRRAWLRLTPFGGGVRPPRRECSAHWDSANVFCCSAGTAATSASGVCAKTLGTGLRTTLVYHKVLEEFLHDDHLLILRKGLKAAAIWQRAASALRQRVDRTLIYSREVNRVFTWAVWVPPGVVPRQGAGGCSRVFFSFPSSAMPDAVGAAMAPPPLLAFSLW